MDNGQFCGQFSKGFRLKNSFNLGMIAVPLQNRGQFNCLEGVPSQVKEVVPHSNPFHAKHLGNSGDESSLLLCSGSSIFDLGSKRRQINFRQGLPIHFAAGSHRQSIKPGENVGHHIPGQLLPQDRLDSLQFHRSGFGIKRADELPSGIIFSNYHHSLTDTIHPSDGALNFPQLNAQAADFNLEIIAAHIDDIAVLPPVGEIAGFI